MTACREVTFDPRGRDVMNIAGFEDLLRAAREQPEPQRLLFVFAGAELPEVLDPQPCQFHGKPSRRITRRVLYPTRPNALAAFASAGANAPYPLMA